MLDSAITAITPHGPAYRGRLAVELAAHGVIYERVAELLWSGELDLDRPADGQTLRTSLGQDNDRGIGAARGTITNPGAGSNTRNRSVAASVRAAGVEARVAGDLAWPRIAVPIAALAKIVGEAAARPLDTMPLVVHLAALADPERGRGESLEAFVRCGRRLIPLLAATLASPFSPAAITRALSASSVARIATRALGLDDAFAPELDRALVLLADHELNASSFTARVAASTDADPYACVAAALATVSGPKHGSASEDLARYAEQLGSPDAARTNIRSLKKRGLAIPAFGHPLYVHGDPRAQPLLEATRRVLEQTTATRGTRRAKVILAIVDAADSSPSVDVGLAALVAALGLDASVASGLFAVARCAGWLAHALEQRDAGYLLRPRARYTGRPIDLPGS